MHYEANSGTTHAKNCGQLLHYYYCTVCNNVNFHRPRTLPHFDSLGRDVGGWALQLTPWSYPLWAGAVPQAHFCTAFLRCDRFEVCITGGIVSNTFVHVSHWTYHLAHWWILPAFKQHNELCPAERKWIKLQSQLYRIQFVWGIWVNSGFCNQCWSVVIMTEMKERGKEVRNKV